MEFGEKITALRKANGMTQAELGAELNVTFQAVSKWERGESLPDFATMSKMAKLFGVPLGYFEDGGENYEEDSAVENGTDRADSKMLGVCTKCGKVVYEGQEDSVNPAIVCRECGDRQRLILKKKQEELKNKREQEERQAKAALEARKYEVRHRRKKGFVGGGIAAGAWIVLFIISAISTKDKTDMGYAVLGALFIAVFSFSFVSQLVWGGTVRDVCTKGGAIIGTPGVIFTLDLDGCIFLLGVKLLFAVLKLIIFVLTSLFFVFIGIMISPFTFVPRLIALNKQV